MLRAELLVLDARWPTAIRYNTPLPVEPSRNVTGKRRLLLNMCDEAGCGVVEAKTGRRLSAANWRVTPRGRRDVAVAGESPAFRREDEAVAGKLLGVKVSLV